MENTGFPNFTIQANSSLLASGDTLVVKCIISNIGLLTLVNSYSINWFKDDVKITKSYNDIIDDGRYSVQLEIASQEKILSRLKITGITDEDEGTFTCELADSNSNKRRQSISILIDDADDTTSIDNRGYHKSNKAANGNTTDQAVIDHENVTYITVAMENITGDIGVYEQTTAYQVETAPRPSQVYTGIIIGICVAVIIIVSVLALIAREMIRRRKITISLNHPGPNYAPQSSRFEHVSIEMNQPLAVIGTSDGFETIDASENTDLLVKNKRRNYEEATDDTFLNEYGTRGDGDRDRPHALQNWTADFKEAIERNDRHDPDQRTDFTYSKIVRTYKIGPAQIRDTSTFSIENASFSVESLETDNVNARDVKTRKHPYEKWNKDFFGEFL